MKQAIITMDENGVPVHVAFDGNNPVPITAFVFLSSVPTEPPSGHVIAFGNSNTIGKLVYGFWAQSVRTNPEGAAVLEMVAQDIVNTASQARGPAFKDLGEGKFH